MERKIITTATTSKAVLELHQSKLVVIRITQPGMLEASDLREILDAQIKLTGKVKSVVVVILKEDTDISTEAREIIFSEELTQYSLKEIYVLKSKIQKILADFYTIFNSTPVPVFTFTKENPAIDMGTRLSIQHNL
ncbi:MAG: hypothetical protein HND27_01105 [Bacteroidetes bacterium]|nr:hypothetical protein [Bacteroidota bacterium]MBV6461318.1 hypothetical protein [Flavobacteriales bacterium]WKZ75282.1 MAG: hypothetical protein QY303_00010 [Vicingaceae bacterium]MCL4816549.1 hypothetical protein [Flavobacteriales bacterium]NOG94355.1 hypothetical protein [Bacteroidota bacterium]